LASKFKLLGIDALDNILHGAILQIPALRNHRSQTLQLTGFRKLSLPQPPYDLLFVPALPQLREDIMARDHIIQCGTEPEDLGLYRGPLDLPLWVIG
jgi:hypothetical protein